MMKQDMEKYTDKDLRVWKKLFNRQIDNLRLKGSDTYINSLNRMSPVLNAAEIPDFEKINGWFSDKTGWKIEVVPGLIPVEDFFDLLAQKRFCSSTWLRNMKNLDYLEEPDMFHDIFGHIPLLADPVFSEFAYEFGKMGVRFKDNEKAIFALQRLYWFTIEFGAISERNKNKVYGAGIISSFGETNKVASGDCQFRPFDIEEILEMAFRTDVMQEVYFVIDALDQLFDSLPLTEKILSQYELVRKRQ